MTTEPNNQELACLVVLDDLAERLREFIDVVGRLPWCTTRDLGQ